MKKSNIYHSLVAFVLLALTFVAGSCANYDNGVRLGDVSISGSQDHAAIVELGATLQLTAYPVSRNVLWTSSDEAVATVSADGLVSAKALGQTVVTVYPAEGDLRNGDYIVITVVDVSVPLDNDEIDQSEAEARGIKYAE